MLPVVPHPIIHLTVLPSPDQTLINPSRDSSHCLKAHALTHFAHICPSMWGMLRKKHISATLESMWPVPSFTHQRQHWAQMEHNLCSPSPKSPYFSEKRAVQAPSGGPERGLPQSLLRLGATWTRKTRQDVRKITAWWILIEPDFQWIVQIHKSDVPHLLQKKKVQYSSCHLTGSEHCGTTQEKD